MTSDDSERRVERRVANGEWRVAAAVRGGEPELSLTRSAAARRASAPSGAWLVVASGECQ